MNLRQKLAVSVVLIISLAILVTFYFTSDDTQANEQVGSDVLRKERLRPQQVRRVDDRELEKKRNEQHLIGVVAFWQEDQPYESRHRVASAIQRLAQLKSEMAIPVLIDKIDFQYLPPDHPELRSPVFNIDRWPSYNELAVAVRALRKIGRPVLPAVVKKLGQLDVKSNRHEIFGLRMVILGILGKSEAIRLLKRSADAETDVRVASRYRDAATSIKNYPVK